MIVLNMFPSNPAMRINYTSGMGLCLVLFGLDSLAAQFQVNRHVAPQLHMGHGFPYHPNWDHPSHSMGFPMFVPLSSIPIAGYLLAMGDGACF